MDIYVGTRLTHAEMNEVVGRRLGRLNQKLSKSLRQAAMDNGVQQTVKRARLEFYSLTAQEYSALKDDARMLIAIDEKEMVSTLHKINSKPEYSGGMTHDVYSEYEKELRSAMSSLVQKIGEDPEAPRKKIKTYTHDFEVGDWIEIYGPWGFLEGNARVVKVTAKTYMYEIAKIRGGRWSNYESAKEKFKNVEGWSHSQNWDFTIPYEGNEWAFTFDAPKTARASKRNPRKVSPGYRDERYHD